jgi:hypothetical protein
MGEGSLIHEENKNVSGAIVQHFFCGHYTPCAIVVSQRCAASAATVRSQCAVRHPARRRTAHDAACACAREAQRPHARGSPLMSTHMSTIATSTISRAPSLAMSPRTQEALRCATRELETVARLSERFDCGRRRCHASPPTLRTARPYPSPSSSSAENTWIPDQTHPRKTSDSAARVPALLSRPSRRHRPEVRSRRGSQRLSDSTIFFRDRRGGTPGMVEATEGAREP